MNNKGIIENKPRFELWKSLAKKKLKISELQEICNKSKFKINFDSFMKLTFTKLGLLKVDKNYKYYWTILK